MKTITFNNQEALQAKTGKVILARPLDPQPEDGYTFDSILSENDYFSLDGSDVKAIAIFSKFPDCAPTGMARSITENIPLQYPVGSRLDVRETWDYLYCEYTDHDTGEIRDIESKFVYKADKELPVHHWHSPSTMPHDAIRKWLVVVDNKIEFKNNVYSEIITCEVE